MGCATRMTFGLTKPGGTGMGADLAGVVESVGKDVTGFSPGDEVFGEVNGETPGEPDLHLGSFAEYVCVSQDWVAAKPSDMTFEQAAAAPLAAITAIQGLRDYANVQPGQKVLINGASGGVGTFAVQIAKAFGAEVTGVCSTRNVAQTRSLGADHVVDYTAADFTEGERRYDLVLDNVGNHPLSRNRRVIEPEGMYLGSFGRPENRVAGPALQLAKISIADRLTGQRIAFLHQHRKKEDIHFLRDLLETGRVTPVIDRVFPLEEAAEALRYQGAGRARGKVVVVV